MVAVGIFAPAELTELRTFVGLAMTATCDVQRRTTTSGAGGARVETWATIVGMDALPCSFKAERAAELIAADATQAVVTYRVRFAAHDWPAGAGITAKDRLSITHDAPGLPNPLVLNVTGVRGKNTDEVARLVLATHATGGGS